MDAAEHLEECKWERPSSYGGHSPEGDYVIYSRTRDSNILGNVNYYRILECLEVHAKRLDEPKVDDPEYTYVRPWVYDFRAGHWACGWVEHIVIRKDAPDCLLKLAGEIYCCMQEYPVFDSSAYSEACYNAICEHWEECSIDERITYCKDSKVSILASRRDEIPCEVYNLLAQQPEFM